MFRLGCAAATAVLLLSANVGPVSRLRAHPQQESDVPRDAQISALPRAGAQPEKPPPVTPPADAPPLSQQSRLEIIRYVSGEFARVLTALPADKDGFRVKAGQAPDAEALRRAILESGASVSAGEQVQITRLEFRDSEIVIDINGGPRDRRSWRERIQVSFGGLSPVRTSTTTSGGRAAPEVEPVPGATLRVDFGRPLPEMTPEELKAYLGQVFDFSNQRSAAVLWAETLPPEIQQAIEEKRAIVGMGPDEVITAMGRPDRKVRERTADGTETEDWIYGHPPAKTVFVRFAEGKVVKVAQYP